MHTILLCRYLANWDTIANQDSSTNRTVDILVVPNVTNVSKAVMFGYHHLTPKNPTKKLRLKLNFITIAMKKMNSQSEHTCLQVSALPVQIDCSFFIAMQSRASYKNQNL